MAVLERAAQTDGRVRRVIAVVEANSGRAWSVGDLAAVAGLSPSRFRQVFSDDVGYSPQEYLGRLRMERGRQLLDEGRTSVKEAAASIGLDVSHFSRDFRRRFGVSPGSYRAQQSQGREQFGHEIGDLAS
jgi:AraC family transcriptional regulator of arabinose operon